MPIKGFPISMGPIVAPVIAEDVDEDGKLDLIAVDTISTLAVFNSKGKLKWDVLLSRNCMAAPAIADINNDGYLDIVTACDSGIIHVTYVSLFPAPFPSSSLFFHSFSLPPSSFHSLFSQLASTSILIRIFLTAPSLSPFSLSIL